MKHVIIIGDGMADDERERTPLEVARTPHLDRIARDGTCGKFVTVPPNYPPGSEVAIMAIMGYDPATYFTGRGPLEAAAMGVELHARDVAARCNLVTIEEGKMKDYAGGHVSSTEGAELVRAVDERLGQPGAIEFHPGVSYRHLLVLRDEYSDRVECAPPHDHLDEAVENLWSTAETEEGEPTAELMNRLVRESWGILAGHPVNARRVQQGDAPANSVWFWGPGRRPQFQTVPRLYGHSGAVITAVDLVRGLGRLAGLEVIEVPGATGYLDTNYEGKARAALAALGENDLVIVHVEAPDEAGHEGSRENKIQAIEDLDRRLVARVLDKLPPPYRLMVCADHPTPLHLRTHTADPPPFAILDTELPGDDVTEFTERAVARGAHGTRQRAHEVFARFLQP